MKFPKDIQKHLYRVTPTKSLLSILEFFIYTLIVFIEIFLRLSAYVFIRIFLVLPIYLGYFFFKISFYYPFLFIFYILRIFLYFCFKKIFFNFFLFLKKLILILFIFFILKKLPSNEKLGLSNKFWFNNQCRTQNLEIDFLEYNRNLSKLIFRKNFMPSRVLFSEKGLTETFLEFKLKITEGLPKYRYDLNLMEEVFIGDAFPILYRLNIDYNDFEYLSKYTLSEGDLKENIIHFTQHKQNHYFLYKSFFNLFYQTDFKYIYNLNYFYNINSFLKNYRDAYKIVRSNFKLEDHIFLNFSEHLNLKKNNKIDLRTMLFYSGNSFWDRFSQDSYLIESGSEMDESYTSLYVPEPQEIYNFSYKYSFIDSTLFKYYFVGPTSFYKRDVVIPPAQTRSFGYARYDFELGERFLFWNFRYSSLSFGNDKFDVLKEEANDDLYFTRYGVLGPILIHDWNFFYPHFFERLIDYGTVLDGEFNQSLLLNPKNYYYYDSFFKYFVNNFSNNFKSYINESKRPLILKNFPPLITTPVVNDSRLSMNENEIQDELEFFVTKYAKTLPKYPYSDLWNEQYTAQKTSLSLWVLKYGKFNHELLWSSRNLGPFSISPTKNRMTTGDFWILRKNFLRGIFETKEIYYSLKNNLLIKYLRITENKLLSLLYLYTPSELLLVELKYFLLNFLLSFSWFDNFLIYLTNLFHIDFLDFKWFLVRLLIILSDFYLWFVIAYIKIIFSIFINMIFDDLCSLILYYSKIFNIYFVDGFLPLQSSIATPQDTLFTEFFFKKNIMQEFFEITSIETNVKRRGSQTEFIINWFRPSERNRKSLYGFYKSPKFRIFYYNLYHRAPYRKRTSYTWRRGNTILLGYGGKYFLKDFYNRKNIKLKRLMRYETTSKNFSSMHHIRNMPYFNYWPNYNFLTFNNYFGLRNLYYNSNYCNLLFFEKSNFHFNLNNLQITNHNMYSYFNNVFNSSLRPKNLMNIFKHFYFFERTRGYNFFNSERSGLYKYDFHYIPFSGYKKAQNIYYELPFKDLLEIPNQYLFQTKINLRRNYFWKIWNFIFTPFYKFPIDKFYKSHSIKFNYFPLMYRYSPLSQYKQYFSLRNWTAFYINGFINSNLVFFPVDLNLLTLNNRIFPKYINNYMFNEFSFNKSSLNNFNFFGFKEFLWLFCDFKMYAYYFSNIKLDVIIKIYNSSNWSFGNDVKLWNYTSSYLEKNFIHFFAVPITSTYTSRFLDDNMRLENSFSVLSYNSLFNRLNSRNRLITGTNLNDKTYLIFIPGYGVKPLDDFFWSHINKLNFDFYYILKFSKEWPIHDVLTLTDERYLNIYNQPNNARPFLMDLRLDQGFDNIIENESGLDIPNNQFDEIDTYYIWDNHRRLHKHYVNTKLMLPYELDNFRDNRFQYKITTARKITFFLIIVWYKFLFQILLLIKFILINYFYQFIFLYFFIIFLIFNLYCMYLLLKNYYFKHRFLIIWLGQRMLLFEREKKFNDFEQINEEDLKILYGYSKKEIQDRISWVNFYIGNNFEKFSISLNYKILRNFLILNFFFDFFKNYSIIFRNELLNFNNLFFSSSFFYKLIIFLNYIKIFYSKFKFFLLLISNKSVIYIYNFFTLKIYYFFFNVFFLRLLNKFWLYFIFSFNFINFFFIYLFNFLKKIFHLVIWLTLFSLFIFILKEYLFLKNFYLTEFPSIILMFLFLLFFIWFFSIMSKTFVESFLFSKYAIDQYLQDYSPDFIGEAFVYEDSLYFYLQPFQEDELFDADSFPFYYSWFTQFLGTNFIYLFFAKKSAQANLEAQEEENYLSGFGSQAENSPKIQGTPAFLNENLKNFFFHVFTTLFRQKDMYRFNNDISLFYEYEENIKTVTNLVTNVNYKNSKNFKKFDLPWEVADNYIFYQYLCNSFWYYHSELFPDTDKLLYFDNAETSTDYNEMMILENRGDALMEPSTTYDLFEGEEGLELIEFSSEDFEIDDVPIELLDFSEETYLREFFSHYEHYFSSKNFIDNNMHYNFYFYNDIAEQRIVKKNGWLDEIIFDRFLINIVNKDFLFPADNELLSFIGQYFHDLDLKNLIDDTFLQTNNENFREFMIHCMLNFKPGNIYRNNIYSAQGLLHLARRLNYKKVPFKKIYVEYLKKFPKGRLFEYNKIMTSFRWDKGIDIATSLYHPHDVLFKLTKSVGLFVFSPYNSSSLKLKYQIIPILGYEMFNNKYKRLFFSNVNYFVKKLNLENYPDLTLSEAERLWNFLGCTQQMWESFDKNHNNISLIFPFDDWDFPFILISFLFAVHYHKSNKLRGPLASRSGAPFGINIISRFQIIKRTEKRRKWKKKRLVKPFETSPTYFFIDLIETISSFFENLVFSKNRSLFFSQNQFIFDLNIFFSDIFLMYWIYFYYLFPDFHFNNYIFVETLSFFFDYFNFFYKQFLIIFLCLSLFIFKLINIISFFNGLFFFEFIFWFNISFFSFFTFFILIFLFCFQNFIFFIIFFYSLYFIFFFLFFEFIDLINILLSFL